MRRLNLKSLRTWTPAKAYTFYYMAQYLFLGVYLPFFPGWLDHKGFSAAAIGAMTGFALIIRLILAPPLAYRAESLPDPRQGLRWSTGAMAAMLALLVLPIPAAMIVMAGVSAWFLFGLLVPLTDTAVLRADRRGELSYGISRGIGSASFMVASLVGGAVITALGDTAVVYWIAAAGIGSFLLSLTIPKEPEEEDGAPKPKPDLTLALSLFRSKSFLLMIFSSGLIQGAHATYYAFSELHWSALGYSSFTIGALWAFGVVVEVVFLFTARSVLQRFNPVLLIAAGALAATIRWPLTGLSPPLFVLFTLQAAHALTFAATYMGSVEFIARAVPSAYRTTAMTIKSALGVGALTGLATVAVGFIFHREAPQAAYGAMGAMGLLALILALWLYRRWDGGLLHAVPKDGPITS